MKARSDNPKDRRDDEIVVFWVVRPTRCTECGSELPDGSLLRLEQEKALCMACADLDSLEFLPRGDPAVTRRASKYSTLRAVVVRGPALASAMSGKESSPSRVRSTGPRKSRWPTPRSGPVARPARPSARTLEDQEYVAEFARAIRAQFPGCPAGEEAMIARHACRKYSDRVGRSAAARAFDPEAIRLAVAAHVRHVHTDYDELLGRIRRPSVGAGERASPGRGHPRPMAVAGRLGAAVSADNDTRLGFGAERVRESLTAPPVLRVRRESSTTGPAAGRG